MGVIFYTRGGVRVSNSSVLKSKLSAAQSRRTGMIGLLKCATNTVMADRIDQMSLIEYANWSGAYTYRKKMNTTPNLKGLV